MRNFKITAETAIQTGKSYKIPPDYIEAWCITKGISWIDFRLMPRHTREKVLQLIELDNYAQSEAMKS